MIKVRHNLIEYLKKLWFNSVRSKFLWSSSVKIYSGVTGLARPQVNHPHLIVVWKESSDKWKVNVLMLGKGLRYLWD